MSTLTLNVNGQNHTVTVNDPSMPLLWVLRDLIGLTGTKGDASAIKEFGAAIRAGKIDSPRGAFTISAANNPVQTIWLREAKNGENRVIGAAAEALADPATGCKMT